VSVPNGEGLSPAVLPHQRLARMIKRLDFVGADEARATAELDPASPYAQRAATCSVAGIEMAAQCAALFCASLDGRPRDGMLVAVKDFALAARMPVGRPISVTVRRLGRARALTRFAAELRLDGELVMAGELSTWIPDRDPAAESRHG
jgi:predicted hotdog family 3-hydroxylacyl-ACP dehydratase